MNTHLIRWGVGSLAYFGWFYGAVGLRTEHVVLWVVAIALWFFNNNTRDFFKNISVWFIYWALYDSLRIAPNWTVNTVHIQDLYEFDKKWFGITMTDGSVLTLNEWCQLHAQPWLDLLSGLFYISWVPLPLLFAVWLYFHNRSLYLKFSWCFFVVNLIGFSIYYLYPAAPPWYVDAYGFGLDPNVPRSAAGLDRVDKMLGIDLFERIYTRNSNVFAAMPSLHSAYPLVTWLYANQSGKAWAKWLFATTSIGIWLSAIYTNHHYVLDVLAGISVAAIGYWIFERIYSKIEKT